MREFYNILIPDLQSRVLHHGKLKLPMGLYVVRDAEVQILGGIRR